MIKEEYNRMMTGYCVEAIKVSNSCLPCSAISGLQIQDML